MVERQIAAAFPNARPSRSSRWPGRSYESLGRTSIETATMPGTTPEEILAQGGSKAGEYVEPVLLGRGVIILVTGHLGNWEFGGAIFAARGVRWSGRAEWPTPFSRPTSVGRGGRSAWKSFTTKMPCAGHRGRCALIAVWRLS
ncbi:MAG: hypothetical protein IPP90_21190 [Gemmatimonadaceae bacterium]|nr:hypothetical protein [Gemmatimonadaceae bacterium]